MDVNELYPNSTVEFTFEDTTGKKRGELKYFKFF